MSSLALPREAARRRALGGVLRALIADHGYEIALAAPMAVLAAKLLLSLPTAFNVDSWLELAAGRLVWQTGLPHHETLTVLAHGAQWIDQQWLSQLAAYGLYRLGGLGLLGLVSSAMLAGSFAATVFASRRLGAPFFSTLIVVPMCLLVVASFREVRTQAFVMPLFALVIYLLARDARRPSRQVFWCLPILVLWANLHGTVTMAAGLVALRGVVELFERRGELLREWRAWRRPALLTAGPVLAILLTPYGLAMIGYYHATMVSSTLRQMVTEWQPVTTIPMTAVGVFLVAGVALWSFGRLPARTTLWEKLALLVLAAGSISVVRNALFFGLFAMMVVPVSLAVGKPASAAAANAGLRTLVNGAMAALAVVILLAAVAATLARPAAAFQNHTQRFGVLSAVERATAADPSLRVMADEGSTDWLLWRDPALTGHLAYDVRFEIYSATQLGALNAFFIQSGLDWQRAARGYRLMVLNRARDAAGASYFAREPGARTLYDDGQQLVVLRGTAEAAR